MPFNNHEILLAPRDPQAHVHARDNLITIQLLPKLPQASLGTYGLVRDLRMRMSWIILY